MAVRSTLASLFAEANTRALEPALRALVEQVLVERGVAYADQLPSADAGLADRVAALEAENAKLKKKLDMAMGAVQAGTAQLMAVRNEAVGASRAAKQAMQAATTARATAESAAEGVTALEERLG